MRTNLTDSTKIEEKITEIHKMIDLKEIFYSLWNLMDENKIEIDFEFYHDPVIMSTKVKINKYTIQNRDEIEEFKRRIQVMCSQIELVDKVPDCSPAHTLYISENQVGLGDHTLTVTPTEMNEIMRFTIKGRFL